MRQSATICGLRRRYLALSVLALLVAVWDASGARASPGSIDLSGTWRFHLDRNDAGVKGEWFDRNLTEAITLPNSTDAAGKGNSNGPDLGQPGRLRVRELL